MKQVLLLLLISFVASDIVLLGKHKRCIRGAIGKREYRDMMEKFEEKEGVDFLQFVNENYPQFEGAIGNCLLAEDNVNGRRLGKTRYDQALNTLGPYIAEKVRDVFRNIEAKKAITKAFKEGDEDTAKTVCKNYVKNEIVCNTVVEIISKRFPKA